MSDPADDPIDEYVEVLTIQFSGAARADGEPVHFGTLVLYPDGDADVLGPDSQPSPMVLLACLHASDQLLRTLPDSAPSQQRTFQALTRALLWQLVERDGAVQEIMDERASAGPVQ